MKKLFFALILTAVSIGAFAQGEVYSSTGKPLKRDRRTEREKGFDPTRVIFGGGFVLGVGGGITDIGISPVIGYRITDKFSAGIGLGYQYYKDKFATQYIDKSTGAIHDYAFKTSIYTASIWARYLIWNNIFVHLEPEMNSFEQWRQPDNFTINKERIYVPSLLVGAGLRQPVSDRLSLVGTILYDVLQEEDSPYKGRLDIRFGINVGF